METISTLSDRQKYFSPLPLMAQKEEELKILSAFKDLYQKAKIISSGQSISDKDIEDLINLTKNLKKLNFISFLFLKLIFLFRSLNQLPPLLLFLSINFVTHHNDRP